MTNKYDFSGWATKFNVKCADGRTIRNSAFKENDGVVVPLVYMHDHSDVQNVIGHALLEYRPEGMYTYGTFNDTPNGLHAKEMVRNGDVTSLSIFANKLKEDRATGDVFHGAIKEVSLVLAGANPGAFIDVPYLEHAEDGFFDATIYTVDQDLELYHDDAGSDDGEDSSEEGEEMAKSEDERTVQDVYDEMTEEQKLAVRYIVEAALEDDEDEEDDEEEYEEEEEEMKHNAFDADSRMANVLTHDDMKTIFDDAKRFGTLKEAVEAHLEDGVLAHAITDGMVGPSASTSSQSYGVRDLDMLFPEYKNLNNPPEWIKRDTGWVQKVMNGTHHTPFSRIKSTYANITADDARALGYIKGNAKKEEVFTLLKRTTSPQTIYKKQKLDRDDITDITDFDVVAWIRAEMRMMLDEEIARAILIGDGRANDSDDKIKEDCVRPIAKDVDLFNIKVNIEVPANSTGAARAKAFIDETIRARKHYKGSGNPKLFTTADMLTEMLLLEDGINHKLYKSTAELATALRVSEIVEVEVMENQKINGADLVGIVVNLQDYNVGADKGGAVSLFDDFDIDYNQYKYLIETRCSGALIKPFSAMTITIAEES